LGRGHHQAPARAGDPQRQLPARQEVHGQGLPPLPLQVQPRRLQPDRRDLERDAGGYRRAARGRQRHPRGWAGPGPRPGAAAVRPRRQRGGHRRDRQAPRL
ncbi:MAG: Manganese catalase, partial [uncultured Rubrobacteraceae bacterium]